MLVLFILMGAVFASVVGALGALGYLLMLKRPLELFLPTWLFLTTVLMTILSMYFLGQAPMASQ